MLPGGVQLGGIDERVGWTAGRMVAPQVLFPPALFFPLMISWGLSCSWGCESREMGQIRGVSSCWPGLSGPDCLAWIVLACW